MITTRKFADIFAHMVCLSQLFESLDFKEK